MVFGIDETDLKHDFNPFLAGVLIKEGQKIEKVIANKEPPRNLKDHEGKKIKEKVVYAKETSYDKTPFIKIYATDLTYINEMSKLGLKLFIHIMQSLKFNSDKVLFNIEDFKDKTGYRHTNKVYPAIKELLRLKVIAKHPINSVFWINPSKVFRGERRYLFMNQD